MVTWLVSQWKADKGPHWSLLVQWSNCSFNRHHWRWQTSTASTHAEVWRIIHNHGADSDDLESQDCRSVSKAKAPPACSVPAAGKAVPARQGNGWSVYCQFLWHTCWQSVTHARSLVKHAQVTFIVRSLCVCRWPAHSNTFNTIISRWHTWKEIELSKHYFKIVDF